MAIIYTAAPLQQPTQPGASGATGYQDILVMRAAVKFGTCRDILESDLGYRSEKYWYNYLYPGETLRAMTTQSYRVAEETATDHHVMTKGGLKLYVLPNDGKITLQQCGAMLDGVSDDTEALRLALDILPDGGTLSIGGTALIQGSVQPTQPRNGVTVTDGTLLRTQGGEASANAPVFDLSGWTRSLFRLSFSLGNDSSASREIAFLLRGCEDLALQDCIFDACHYGVLGSGAVSRDIRLLNCRGVNARSEHEASVAAGMVAAQGGGAMVFGNDVLNEVTIDQCEGRGWNHLALSGDASGWTVSNSAMDDSGDSTIYLRGSNHLVQNCAIRRAGKDGIKILDYRSGARGEYNIISDCRVLGAGYTKSDGGICVNLETDHSKIAGLVLQVDATSALASEATSGVTVSGENILVENVVVNGAGGYAEAGVGVGVSINNSARNTSHLTLSNLRATAVRYACTMYSRPGWTVSRVVLSDLWCRDVDGAVMVYDLSQNTSRVTVSGGGLDGASSHGMTFAGVADLTVEGFAFMNVAGDAYCLNIRQGSSGRFLGCAWDSTALAPVKTDQAGPGTQRGNDWNYCDRATGPVPGTWWWVGDRVRFRETAPGEVPGLICTASGTVAGGGAVFAEEAALPS
ncbi:right-handed parallel beta-helix repeat-containing protein [Pseudooceanicola sp. 200-1SW]|uniref:right-handed parallel beta-helix repeat-containing protein n=1 Tax=Pseudooceanicola sp. 200-1SW TaxID=3425949 RepID=UPI003D7FB9AC